MFPGRQDLLYELFLRRGLLAPAECGALRDQAIAAGRCPADVALDNGMLEREELIRGLAAYLDRPFRLKRDPPTASGLLPGSLARAFRVVPFRVSGDVLEVLAADPFALEAEADLGALLGSPVRFVVADPRDVLAWLAAREDEQKKPESVVETSSSDAPVARWVGEVLIQAVLDRASDVHFEPMVDELRVRTRIDGVLGLRGRRPADWGRSAVTRLKVLAGLDSAEERRPQDGRFRMRVGTEATDFRVATLAGIHGESAVVRLLDPIALRPGLEGLGLERSEQRRLRSLLRRVHGLLLVTGPTGAGKTTTLHACLRELNTSDRKIVTIEDPVEYFLADAVQVGVDPAAGITFASALRSLLRHDPDVILVGEIRDAETAALAVRAALTGHLVLASLHANDAPGAVARLRELGVEPPLLAEVLRGVLAQRLVRRICSGCRQPGGSLPPGMGAGDRVPPPAWVRGSGCARCADTGISGRRLLLEIWEPGKVTRRELTANIQGADWTRLAQDDGWRPAAEAAVHAYAAGEIPTEDAMLLMAEGDPATAHAPRREAR